MSEVVGQPAVLQRDSGVDEGRGTAVVIHKERLQSESDIKRQKEKQSERL